MLAVVDDMSALAEGWSICTDDWSGSRGGGDILMKLSVDGCRGVALGLRRCQKPPGLSYLECACPMVTVLAGLAPSLLPSSTNGTLNR